MQDHDIESLNHLRAVYTDRIDRFRSPQAERSFREYASAVTLLSGELAITAMPALNRWNGFSE